MTPTNPAKLPVLPRTAILAAFCTLLVYASPAAAQKKDKPKTEAPSAASSAQPAAQDEAIPPRVEQAVDRALEYLKKNQKPDGTWAAGPRGGNTAIPSFAIMAFLARGHVPGQGPHGELLNKAIDQVLACQQPNGLMSKQAGGNHVMYEHGITTSMLAEVYGMVDESRREKVEQALAKAVRATLDAQKFPKPPQFKGGWRYQLQSGDADISVTGWQLMSLRAAANCGAPVPKEAIEEGRQFIKRCAVRGGGFSYQPGSDANPARTGTGILAMELLGEHHSPEALAGANFLVNAPLDKPSNMPYYFYAVYYVSQALNQVGDKYWDNLYPKLRDGVLALQQPDGSIVLTGGNEHDVGPIYETSMSVLALCVPYRYLPLYQK